MFSRNAMLLRNTRSLSQCIEIFIALKCIEGFCKRDALFSQLPLKLLVFITFKGGKFRIHSPNLFCRFPFKTAIGLKLNREKNC